MKSASVGLPGSGENLQITPKGLLKAISICSRGRGPSVQRALDQVGRNGSAGHAPRGAAPAALAAPLATANGLEPFTHVRLEPDAVHVVVERLAQPRAQVVVIRTRGVFE